RANGAASAHPAVAAVAEPEAVRGTTRTAVATVGPDRDGVAAISTVAGYAVEGVPTGTAHASFEAVTAGAAVAVVGDAASTAGFTGHSAGPAIAAVTEPQTACGAVGVEHGSVGTIADQHALAADVIPERV